MLKNELSIVLFHAFSKGHPAYCNDANCAERIAGLGGSYFITFGHAGFNSPTNNRGGYNSHGTAAAAHRRYASKGKR